MADGARPIRIGWWLSSEEHDPRRLVDHARMAERSGVTTAMVSDHLHPWTRRQGQASAVWPVIGAIAEATDALEVGTGVVAMVHRTHPIELAHAAATAAVMLEDRFFLGVGSGERLNEQPFGERWPRAGERREMMREGVELLREIFDGGNVNRRGATWSVEHLQLFTRPAAPPPILLAASGKRSAALAGEVADGIIGVTPDYRLIDSFRSAGGAGKPCLAQLHVCLAASEDDARATAWEWWPNGVVPSKVLSELARPQHFEDVARAIGEGPIGEQVVCCADAAPVIAAIDRFVGAGFDTVYVHQVGPDQERLAAVLEREVLPHYAAASGGSRASAGAADSR